jgi:hypothetical protein
MAYHSAKTFGALAIAFFVMYVIAVLFLYSQIPPGMEEMGPPKRPVLGVGAGALFGVFVIASLMCLAMGCDTGLYHTKIEQPEQPEQI